MNTKGVSLFSEFVSLLRDRRFPVLQNIFAPRFHLKVLDFRALTAPPTDAGLVTPPIFSLYFSLIPGNETCSTVTASATTHSDIGGDFPVIGNQRRIGRVVCVGRVSTTTAFDLLGTFRPLCLCTRNFVSRKRRFGSKRPGSNARLQR
jgi:hypothetical protein